jgi:hypothetical protein
MKNILKNKMALYMLSTDIAIVYYYLIPGPFTRAYLDIFKFVLFGLILIGAVAWGTLKIAQPMAQSEGGEKVREMLLKHSSEKHPKAELFETLHLYLNCIPMLVFMFFGLQDYVLFALSLAGALVSYKVNKLARTFRKEQEQVKALNELYRKPAYSE